MIENIIINNITYAIILRVSYNSDGIKFFTPDNFSQQLGYMNRPAGYKIDPHYHVKHKRLISFTQEVLFVKSGKVKVNFFNENKEYIADIVLYPGDVILLADGAHGFEMIEQSEMIEVKQGPYIKDQDKVIFKND